jgi:DNA-binding transcriptional regulator YiaG
LKNAVSRNIFNEKHPSRWSSREQKASIVGKDGRENQLFDNLADDQLLTAEQLAERLNISVKTVRKWRYESILPPEAMVKLRHQVRYRWGKVLAWIATREV